MENSSNPEVGATSAAKAGARGDEITRQERHDMVWLRDVVLPDDGLSDDMYRLAVPIWCEMPHEYLAEKLGPEYACGFAYGLEKGLILANLRPEWARGLYQLIRSHYVQAHPEEDPVDWEEQAEQTVRAIPVELF
jgi:hypothetical protein